MSEINKTQELNEQLTSGLICSELSKSGFSVKQVGATKDNIEVVNVPSENLLEVATYLKMNKNTQFDLLFSVTGTDYLEYIELSYHLLSTVFNKQLIVKTSVDKSNLKIESLSKVFSAANWHERETFDLLGVEFLNHPNLERILLPNDWKGYPLRKNYVMNDERLVWNER